MTGAEQPRALSRVFSTSVINTDCHFCNSDDPLRACCSLLSPGPGAQPAYPHACLFLSSSIVRHHGVDGKSCADRWLLALPQLHPGCCVGIMKAEKRGNQGGPDLSSRPTLIYLRCQLCKLSMEPSLQSHDPLGRLNGRSTPLYSTLLQSMTLTE